MSEKIEYHDFWEKVKTEKNLEGDYVFTFGFGDSKEMKDELLELVLQGIKLATTSLVKELEIMNEPTPVVGDYNILLDGDDNPRAVVRTLDTRLMKLRDVPAEHAWVEGEDDRTLETWMEGHIRYWGRVGKEQGFDFNEDMEVILERFEVIYP